MNISQEFRTAVKLSPLRDYQIAHLAGIHPCTLSKLLNGIEFPRPGDERIISVARVLNFPVERCFTQNRSSHNTHPGG